MTMTPEDIEALFTRRDGSYAFARWGRPIAPIVFGVEDDTLKTFKGALEALSAITRHPPAETDPELGSNLMFFLFRDWSELRDVPDLDRLVPELDSLVPRLEAEGANQYRLFRFDAQGAIKAAFSFIRMDESLQKWSAESLALMQAVQVFVMWGDGAFAERSPLARLSEGGADILRPEIASVLTAAYAPELNATASDPAHALRLFARTQA